MCVSSSMSVDLSLSELTSGGPHDGTHRVPTKVKHGKGEHEHPGV